MVEDRLVHIGENSPEHVAFRLMETIAHAEGKTFFQESGLGAQTADRRWILETYTPCLNAVRGG